VALPHLLPSAGACCAPVAISTDISCLLDAQQQTRRLPLLLLIDGTDKQTNGQTPNRYIDPAGTM